MTRQRRWQLNQRAKGLCMICPRPSVRASLCEWHLLKRRAQDRARRGNAPWQPGHPGRPPKQEDQTMSRPCDQCHQVKMVKMYIERDTNRPLYLCKADARELGYFVDNAPASAVHSPQISNQLPGGPTMVRTPKYPPVDFSTLSYAPASRPLARGTLPLTPFHEALLATYGVEGASISVSPPPMNLTAFLSQLRAAYRKHGHKIRLAHRQEGGALLLWAEEGRTRKPRVRKVKPAEAVTA